MSLVSVWDELWAVITDPEALDETPEALDLPAHPSLTEVRRAYKGEPVKGYQLAGLWIAITATGNDTGGDLWNYILRVYATVTERPIEIQLQVAKTVDQIEALLDTNNRFEQRDWNIGITQDLGLWIASLQCPGPREP